MASLHVLICSLSPLSVSKSRRKLCGSKVSNFQNHRSPKILSYRTFRVACKVQEDDNQSKGSRLGLQSSSKALRLMVSASRLGLTVSASALVQRLRPAAKAVLVVKYRDLVHRLRLAVKSRDCDPRWGMGHVVRWPSMCLVIVIPLVVLGYVPHVVITIPLVVPRYVPHVILGGEELPESLFMKELKKRGMTPISLLEESNRSIFWDDEMNFKEEERGYSKRNAVTTDYEKGLYAESEPSTALNSGLKVGTFFCIKGLDSPIWTFAIPRRNVLLNILAVDLHNSGILLCSILSCDVMGISHDHGSYEVCNLEVLSRRNCGPEVYFFDLDVEYCGSAFVHDGSAITLPQYVDPYALLEDEMISQTAALVN
ncbi:hypothetical protein RHSIM_Rhsim05G0093200 [Rhododendron simsii]|uniref:Uncharacterized protein n=1 Tax=Rhododendron simsii TaxID=118357 RepID=A0A834LMB9_RHOSS|nr:hypothetical protein RHSIM_Rhsim05G0093200 [Rhododendron simsii]